MIFTRQELTLIQWMLETATENNPNDEELSGLNYKVGDLIAQLDQEEKVSAR